MTFKKIFSSSSSSSLPPLDPRDHPDLLLVGHRGLWYDVTGFAEKHPGGPVIKRFAGADATAAIEAWHSRDVVRHRRPVGRLPDGYNNNSSFNRSNGNKGNISDSNNDNDNDNNDSQVFKEGSQSSQSDGYPDLDSKSGSGSSESSDEERRGRGRRGRRSGQPTQQPQQPQVSELPPPPSSSEFLDEAERDFYELSRRFETEGWYNPDPRWYARRVAACAGLLCGAVAMGYGYGRWYETRAGLVAGGLLLTAFWQQCGFMMHDAMHTQVHRSRRVCEALGTLFGTVCLGVSGMWWKDEHIVHHSLTNTYGEDGVTDPQMTEEVWAQNEKLLPFFSTSLRRLLVRVQHITFLPLVFVTGRIAIVADSFKDEARVSQWLAGALHWAWVAALLSLIPTWRDRALFYAVAAVGQGVLHVQLLISHYAKPFESVDIAPGIGWFRYQASVNLNIDCPEWADPFHGGLNLHIEHHLFPRLPRHRLRGAQPRVKELCRKHGLPYDSVPFTEAVRLTLCTLRDVGRLVDWVDPR